jgi:UPF0755 protein
VSESQNPKRSHSRLFKLVKGVFYVGILFAFIVGGAAAWFWHDFNAAGPLREAKTVVIPKGAGTSGIARVLTDAGVIESPLVFKIGARLTAEGAALHAGEFSFPAAVSPRGAMDVLIEGKVVLHRVTIAEGLTVSEVYDVLNAQADLEGPVPPKPAEGTLLPETYFFVLGDTRAQLIDRMSSEMSAKLAELWESRDKAIPLTTPEEAVTLASLIEKETSQDDERARVAGVFYNRLKKGMALQSDPTVIYVLTDGKGKLDRALTTADLKLDNPYNTYVITGLPKGPIANPGLASLKAVMRPQTTKDLYFVADGTGGHAFAETLDQHNKNVAKWRKFLKSQADKTSEDGEGEN